LLHDEIKDIRKLSGIWKEGRCRRLKNTKGQRDGTTSMSADQQRRSGKARARCCMCVCADRTPSRIRRLL
jgi:hypothetical protein